jgi:hypothetical protein
VHLPSILVSTPQVAATAQPAPAKPAAKPATMVDDDDEAPRFFNPGRVRSALACGISSAVHMALIIALGLWTIQLMRKDKPQELVAEVDMHRQEQLTRVLEEEIKPSTKLSLVSTATSSVAGAQGIAKQVLSERKVAAKVLQTSTDAPKVEVGMADVFASNGTVLSEALPEGQLGDAMQVADSYGEAMDQITREILHRLASGKVLIIWCFDQSGSMEDDRAEISARINRVYEELKLSKEFNQPGDPLLTAVSSYSSTTRFETKQPTADIEAIRAAISGVPTDESGVENMCQAVIESVTAHRRFATSGRRQLMLVLVTDESGDAASNHQLLEETIRQAKGSRCPLYVLGREAVFGYPYAHMRWQDPKTELMFWIRIDRGPETPFPEQLQVDGLHRRWDAHASGSGPYEQARMARETGGIFFMLPSPETNLVQRDNRKYEIEAMRAYLPDLSDRESYAAERDKYQMRRIIWKVIMDLNPYDARRRVEVRIDNFPIDNDQFARLATQEIHQAELLAGYFKEAELALEKAKPLRAREPSPRWRADYDMIYAQSIAYQVRQYEYIACLQAFLQNPKPIKNIFGPRRPTNAWDIHYSNKNLTGDKYQKERTKAVELFFAIMTEHAGTPYATRAQWELARGFSVDLREDYEDPRRAGVKVPKL